MRRQMEDTWATVLSVDPLPLPYYCLRLRVHAAFAETEPGQFVMVQAGEGREPLLRRAFSIHDVSKEGDETRIDLLGKIVGRGTEFLAYVRPDEELRVLGPLGHGFGLGERSRVALIAGGVGSAALLILARELLARACCFDFFYGGRAAVDLSRSQVFGRLAELSGGELVATTDDGSRGFHGLVTEALEPRLRDGTYEFIYTCGPMPLLAAIAELSRRFDVEGEAALETPMGCGYGACLGCAVPHVDGRWALCCTDGPVFGLDEVRWHEVGG